MNEPQTILVITAGGAFPWAIINALADEFTHVQVLVEEPESKTLFLRRRARKLGWLTTAGQFATMALSKIGKHFTRRREQQLIAAHGLKIRPAADVPLTRVPSANSIDCIAAVGAIRPAVILLVSCRMLSKTTLAALTCPVLNYHSGINPKYRGLMGGYWARAGGDPANYGTTVHLVDAGVDTGDVLYHAFLPPDPRETMFTDALAQAAGSRGIVIAAIKDALSGNLNPKATDLPSRQYYHPPIWSYLATGMLKGVW